MRQLLALIVIWMAVLACSAPSEEVAESVPEAAEKPVIYVTNYPLRYFTERIAGPLVDVVLLVPAGEDPAYWKPAAEDVLAMQQGDMIVLNGASYESWLETVSLPPSRMVDTTEAVRDRLIPLENQTTHSHGLEGEHEHSGTAFTTWLDPTLAAAQAGVIKNALAERWPSRTGELEARLAELVEDLTALDAEAQAVVAGNTELRVLFSHPVYQYLARRYSLDSRSLHWEPDQMPDESQWQELRVTLVDFPASWMIWEDAPLPEVREGLEALGVRSTVFDPCGVAPGSGDFLSVMRENLEALRLVYAPVPVA